MHEACGGAFFEVVGSLIWFCSLCRGCRACQPLWWSDRPSLSSSPTPAVRRLNASLHAHWRPHYGAERSGISCAPTLQVTGRWGTGVRMKRVHNCAENKNYPVPPHTPHPSTPSQITIFGGNARKQAQLRSNWYFFLLFLGNGAFIAICLTSSQAWWLAERCCLSDGDWLRPAGTGSDSVVPTVPPWEKSEVPYTHSYCRPETQRQCVFAIARLHMLVWVMSSLPPCLSVCNNALSAGCGRSIEGYVDVKCMMEFREGRGHVFDMLAPSSPLSCATNVIWTHWFCFLFFNLLELLVQIIYHEHFCWNLSINTKRCPLMCDGIGFCVPENISLIIFVICFRYGDA